MTPRSTWAVLAGEIALALMLVIFLPAGAVAQGWLYAFVLISMVPIGSLALLLVHGICGGRWGRDLEPILAPAARCVPLLFIAFLPVLFFRPLVYHWSALHLPADVARYYLNPPFFAARTFIALAIWSGLAWKRAWKSELLAGLGLVAHLILMTFVPADWVLTIGPGGGSAGFGLGFGIEQMFAALAVAAVLAPRKREARANRDLAGLLVTTLLGTMYFVYMQFVIIWYGNVPDKVAWYAARADGLWPFLALAAFTVGVALPFLSILNPTVRREPNALRVVGMLVLAGIVLHVAWLILPVFGAFTIVPAGLAAVLLALSISSASRTSPIAWKEGVHGR